MTEETIFSKVIHREILADIVYQDNLVTAFRDSKPQAPTHILIVPRKPIPTLDEVAEEDEIILGRMIWVATKIAKREGISEKGYRLIVNCKDDAGQEIYHLHMHLLGGKPLGPLLGELPKTLAR